MPVNTKQDRNTAARLARSIRKDSPGKRTRREINLQATQSAYNFLSSAAFMRNNRPTPGEMRLYLAYRREELRSEFDSKQPGGM